MANVIVTGLPGNALMKKVVLMLRKKLKKERVKNFWITKQWDGDNKQLIIKFDTGYDAHRSLSVLDNFIYFSNVGEYPLRARIESNRSHRSPSPYDLEMDPHYDRYDRHFRERSRSPLHNREVSKLDMEIELLRKQRQIIEEERRLLLERKKLDLIREFGPNAINDFDYIEEPYERRRPEREQSKKFKRRQSPPPKNFQTNFTPKGSPLGDGIPKFFLPCKKLMDKMKNMTSNCATKQEAELLVKLVRTTIRKRIAVALEGKRYMSTPDILTMYRERYPVATDDILVKKLLKGIKDSMLSLEDKNGEEIKKQETTNELNKAGPSSVGGLRNESVNVEIKKSETKVNDELNKEEDMANENQPKTNDNQAQLHENPSKTDENLVKTNKNQGEINENENKSDLNHGKTDENQAKTNENQSMVNLNQVKIHEDQGKTDENQAKTNENEGKTDENKTKTNENEGKTDENKTKTNENEGKTDENQAKVIESQVKANENQAKANENQAKANENQAKANENQAKANENQSETNENQGNSIDIECQDEFKEMNNEGSFTEVPEHDAEANKGLFEDGTDWNDDEHLGMSAA